MVISVTGAISSKSRAAGAPGGGGDGVFQQADEFVALKDATVLIPR